MKTIQTKVYQLSELSAKAKEKARDWYRRSCDGDNYFAEAVIEDAGTIAGMMGIKFKSRNVPLCGGDTRQEPTIYWSGFSSQGDGACFEGAWHASAVKPGAVNEYVGNEPPCMEIKRIATEFERIAKAYPESSFTVKHSGHYYHEHCTEFDFQFPDDDQAIDGGDWPENKRESYNAECEALKENAKDFMRWIYRQLEKEYEYQNSDEAVDESIEANEYDFTEDGSRF